MDTSPPPRFPWLATTLAVVALLAATGGWLRARNLASQAARISAQHDALQAKLKALQPRLEVAEASASEIQRLRKQVEELARLRGQYQEWQLLRQDYDRVREENTQLRAALQQASQAPRQPGSSWIGIVMQPQPEGGVAIQGLVPGSPATGSGLAPGDIITAVDNQRVSSPQEFRDLITSRPVGASVTLDAQRQGRTFRVVLATAALPP